MYKALEVSGGLPKPFCCLTKGTVLDPQMEQASPTLSAHTRNSLCIPFEGCIWDLLKEFTLIDDLTCIHRLHVLQDYPHSAVEHLYGTVLRDEVFGHWGDRGGELTHRRLHTDTIHTMS